MTISKEILDLKNTINMLKEKGYKEFVLLGGSFGASIVSLFPYSETNDIKGIVLWYGALNYDYINMETYLQRKTKRLLKMMGFIFRKA